MKYVSFFTNSRGIVCKGFIEYLDTDSEYIFPLYLNEIIIETDGFELLTIDNPQQYSTKQLNQFDYEIRYPFNDQTKELLVLTNYKLETFIPIFVLEVSTAKIIEAELKITLNHCGENEKRECALLGRISSNSDLEAAFHEIQSELSPSYIMRTCSNCKNSTFNPYGGNEFFNQLCFVKEAKEFQKIESKAKMSIVEFMKFENERNFDSVLLTHTCEKFEAR